MTLQHSTGLLITTNLDCKKYSLMVKASGKMFITPNHNIPGLHLQAILWEAIPNNLPGLPGDKSQSQDDVLNYFDFNSLTNYSWVHFVSPDNDYIGWDNNPRFPQAINLTSGIPVPNLLPSTCVEPRIILRSTLTRLS